MVCPAAWSIERDFRSILHKKISFLNRWHLGLKITLRLILRRKTPVDDLPRNVEY